MDSQKEWKVEESLPDWEKNTHLERICINTDGRSLLKKRVEDGYCLRPSMMAWTYGNMSNCSIAGKHNWCGLRVFGFSTKTEV